MIKIKKVNPNAVIPNRGSALAAGLDLRTTEGVVLAPGKRALLPTGLAFEIPSNSVGLIWPRSKLAAKKGIDVLAGVVDADYRGEVHVSLLNTSEDPVELEAGDKVAQLIVQFCDMSEPVEVEHLSETERGGSGVLDSEMRLRG